jgi:rubrerythrin
MEGLSRSDLLNLKKAVKDRLRQLDLAEFEQNRDRAQKIWNSSDKSQEFYLENRRLFWWFQKFDLEYDCIMCNESVRHGFIFLLDTCVIVCPACYHCDQFPTFNSMVRPNLLQFTEVR